MNRSPVEIDDLLRSGKGLWGSPDWIEDGPKALLKHTLTDERGVILGGLFLALWAETQTAVQRGAAALILDDQVIQRLSYKPSNSHRNDNAHPTPPALRLKSLPADRSRI